MTKTSTLEPMADPASRPKAGGYMHSDLDVDTHWHSHDMHQILYAFEGVVAIEDDHLHYLLPRHSAAWIPAGITHRTSIHEVRSGSVFFDTKMVPNADERIRIVMVPPLMREMVIEAMRWPITEPGNDLSFSFFSTFSLLCREWITHEAKLFLPRTDEPKLERAMAYTRAHLDDVTLASVCNIAGFSERSLRRRFRDDTGMTWEDYRQKARIIRAVTLLGEGSLPISTISSMVGYESQSAFAKTFRTLLGDSPSDYRRRLKG